MKTKVIELLYSWTLALPEESKIKDAYHMLKRQGMRMSAQAGAAGLGFEGLRCVRPAGLVPGPPPLLCGKGCQGGPACATTAPSPFRHRAFRPADLCGQDADPVSTASSQKPCF